LSDSFTYIKKKIFVSIIIFQFAQLRTILIPA